MNLKKILLPSVLAALIILIGVFGFLVIESKNPEKLSVDLSGYREMEHAKYAIREFIGNPFAVLEYAGIWKYYPFGNPYKFTSDDGGEFYVDPVTFEVCRAHFPSAVGEGSAVRFSLDEAEGIARDFIAEKTCRTEAENLDLVEGKLLDYAGLNEYSLIFNEIEDGVSLFNHVSVVLSADTGNIMTYSRMYRETEVSLVPAISEEEAIEIAGDQFKGFRVRESDPRLMVHYPEGNEQKLVWLVRITGGGGDSDMAGALVLIDAQTGEVYDTSAYG